MAKALGVSERELRRVVARAPHMYRLASEKAQAEAGGKGKIVYNPRWPLKRIQQRINERLLGEVVFPDYINGGIRGRSYRDDSARHTESQSVINLDIRTFYESVREKHVRLLWQRFFHFPQDVAELLTRLTVHQGALPRGGPASLNLANLIFWDHESRLVKEFAKQELSYTRYVDDVTISAQQKLSRPVIGDAVGRTYKMFSRKGLAPNREKLNVSFGNGPLRVHGVNVNGKRPTIPKDKRREIRAAVNALVGELEACGLGCLQVERLNHLQGKLGWMGMFHPTQAAKLRDRLKLAVEKARKQPPM